MADREVHAAAHDNRIWFRMPYHAETTTHAMFVLVDHWSWVS
jgi:hypothetical protein